MKKIILLPSVFTVVAAMTACAADGKALWDQHCAKCHGKDGKGLPDSDIRTLVPTLRWLMGHRSKGGSF